MDKGIYYHFSKMDLKQFATFEENIIDETKDINISCSVSFAYSFEQNTVLCTITIVYLIEDKPILKANLEAYFVISAESVDNLIENDEIILPTNLQIQFASLVYGSMRGIIFAKTSDSVLGKFILPPYDVTQVLKNPARFQKSSIKSE